MKFCSPCRSYSWFLIKPKSAIWFENKIILSPTMIFCICVLNGKKKREDWISEIYHPCSAIKLINAYYRYIINFFIIWNKFKNYTKYNIYQIQTLKKLGKSQKQGNLFYVSPINFCPNFLFKYSQFAAFFCL